DNEVGSLAFEFRGKGTALFGHLTPRSGEHSRLNGCPVSLDHYTFLSGAGKDSILDLFLGCFKSKKWSNSKQGYWILPIANGQTIIKLAVAIVQDQQ
uniref:hypothetical protein n=1 Tax=Pseudomonas sp. EA_35y_Pfl1_P108 TaxID=3088688 RepID=UPI0030DB2E00